MSFVLFCFVFNCWFLNIVSLYQTDITKMAGTGNYSRTQVRVMLWAPPQSVSTAFQNCMSFVDDIQIINEPYHSSSLDNFDTALTSPGDMRDADSFKTITNPLSAFIPEVKSVNLEGDFDKSFCNVRWDSKECNTKWVKNLLEGAFPGRKYVFAKDLICGIRDQYDMIPTGYRHTFLIRNPTKLVLSQRKVAKTLFTLPDKAFSMSHIPIAFRNWYQQMMNFYEYLKDSNIESDPIIIDADDVQDFPESIIQQYCSALGIPYRKSLLQWPAGNSCIKNNWLISKTALQGNAIFGFYKAALDSTRFEPSKPIPSETDIPRDVLDVIKCEESYYRKLYDKRLKP